MTTPEEWWNRLAPDVQQGLMEADPYGPVPGHLIPRLTVAGRSPVGASSHFLSAEDGGPFFLADDLQQ